jgi:methionyl-tRNA formyltransferase
VRTVFFGTPEIAVLALRALAKVSEVVGVVCQPDRRAGRGLSLRTPAVKDQAQKLGLEVAQPLRLKEPEIATWLRERTPEVAVVMAYGRILPPDLLAIPLRGCVNLHASCLPRHRGAAPIQWALLEGDITTGVSLMQMDVGLDTGPVYLTREIPIFPEDDTGSLSLRIAELAARIVSEDLIPILASGNTALPQDATSATWAPPIEPKDQHLDFYKTAQVLGRQVRALSPRPGAVTSLPNKKLKVHLAAPCDITVSGPPGRVTATPERRILVATGLGSLEILRAQVEGRGVVGAADLLNGRAVRDGDILGSDQPVVVD